METSRSPLEEEIRALATSVADLQRRLASVEDQLRTTSPPSAAASLAPTDTTQAAVDSLTALALSSARVVPLGGRLLVVLGGAYVVRALTDGQILPPLAGVGLGLLYALVWLGVAARTARGGDGLGATWHAATTALIAYPLIWETTAQFALLSYPAAAAAIGGVTVLGLAAAARGGLRHVPAFFSSGAALCAHAILLPHAGSTASLTIVLILLGLLTFRLGRPRAWVAPVWIAALAADAAGLYVVSEALEVGGQVSPAAGLGILLALFLGYVASIAHAAIRRLKRLDAFGVVQTALVLVVGLGGTLWIADARRLAPTLFGLASLIVALLAYVFAFTLLDRERRRCFYYLATIGLVLVLAGSGTLLALPALPWAALAVAAAVLARRFGRFTLGVHAALYALAAALASGLLAAAADGWMAAADPVWRAPSTVAYLALVAAIACALVRVGPPETPRPLLRWVPATVLLLLVAFCAGGLVVHGITALLGTAGATPDPGILAVLRTAVLALVTLGTALVARSGLLPPARHLIYPLLGAGALKLLLEDLPSGRAATLAASFVLYGAVVILAPRLVRPRAAAADAAVDPAA